MSHRGHRGHRDLKEFFSVLSVILLMKLLFFCEEYYGAQCSKVMMMQILGCGCHPPLWLKIG
jgi:hypothetical protein